MFYKKPLNQVPHGAARPGYLPGLDGLRALSVVAVLLYHADLDWARGGFLGVEVFFVISGYLITSILLAEWRAHGHVDLKGFWLRRARRLLPALFVLLAGTLAFAVIFRPEEVASLRRDVLAAFGYVTNWYLIFSHQSYFQVWERPSLLRHLWSLAVEEQFYLLWPLLFVAAMRWLRRPRYILPALLAGIAGSSILMGVLYQPGADPSRVYYGTDTRAAGLLAGAALAYIWLPGGRLQTLSRGRRADVIGLLALLMLGGAFGRMDETSALLYQGGFLGVALASALAIAAATHPDSRLGRHVLGWSPLAWIGQRSYGLYLWHWPVYMLTRPGLDLALEGPALLGLRLCVTLVLTELSYRYVETPMRQGALERTWHAWRTSSGVSRRWIALRGGTAGAIFLAFTVALGDSVVSAQPPPPPVYLAVTEVDTVAGPDAGVEVQPGTIVPRPTSLPILPAVILTATPSLSEGSPLSSLTSGDNGTPLHSPCLPVPASSAVTRTPVSATPIPTAIPMATGDGLAEPARPLVERKWFRFAPADQTSVSTTPVPTGTPTAVPTAPAPTETATPLPTAQPQPTAAVAEAPTPARPTATAASQSTRIVAIGDSVMIGAAGALEAALPGIEIDAKQARQAADVVALLESHEAAGLLGDVLVVHLGSNGTFTAKQFDAIMGIAGAERRVVFINAKVPRRWESTNNTLMAESVSRYPNAVLADWHAAGVEHPEYFWGDGIHLRPEGAKAFAALVAQQAP